ncbi:MAG: hypothetical protein EBQ96_08645 [Proteobacteria bacterium]|nr:hypothetical protein [Pseudomonadota bacterium]
MSETLLLVIGLIGAACPVTMYYLLEQEKVDPKGLLFFGVNGIGSVLIIIASVGEFDWGDIGAVAMETAWLVISVMGIWKVFSLNRKQKESKHG